MRPEKLVDTANGFYWTEGNRGVGWGAGVVPTIKGSTTAGIPSSPGVWIPSARPEDKFRTPSIEALEILQGYPAGWTAAASIRDRWKLVGNAVAVPVAKWIAEGLRDYDDLDTPHLDDYFRPIPSWDWAAYSTSGGKVTGRVPHAPMGTSIAHRYTLKTLLEKRGSAPLSRRATRGFTTRLQRSNLTRNDDFMHDLVTYSGL
jgi:DNA (cytosine-5)-methyltransferase 1